MQIVINSSSELIQLDTIFDWRTYGEKIADLNVAICLIQENLEGIAANSIRRLLAKFDLSNSELVSRFNYALDKQGLGKTTLKLKINIDGISHSIEYEIHKASSEVVESWQECQKVPYWHFTILRAAVNPMFMAGYKE